MAVSHFQWLLTRVLLVIVVFALFSLPAYGNVQIYRTSQHGADAQGNIVWTPQTIVSMADSNGQYFDLEFEVDAGLTMFDAWGKILWSTNTGGHDCRTGYCALRWTPSGQLQILVETERGPQPIWQTSVFGDGSYLTFGATVPFVAVYSRDYTMGYSSGGLTDNGATDLLQLCNSGAVTCYNCDGFNCLSGGDDGTLGSDVWGDPNNQPGFSG